MPNNKFGTPPPRGVGTPTLGNPGSATDYLKTRQEEKLCSIPASPSATAMCLALSQTAEYNRVVHDMIELYILGPNLH